MQNKLMLEASVPYITLDGKIFYNNPINKYSFASIYRQTVNRNAPTHHYQIVFTETKCCWKYLNQEEMEKDYQRILNIP